MDQRLTPEVMFARLISSRMVVGLPQAMHIGMKERAPGPLWAPLVNQSTFDRPASKSLEENLFYERYKDKLLKKKEVAPQEFEAAVQDMYEKKQEKTGPVKQSDIQSSAMMSRMSKTSAHENRKPSAISATPSGTKKLDSIIKLSMLADKSASEIASIWSTYHSSKDCIFAVTPPHAYQRLFEKGTKCPLFIYPVPRSQGYEFFLGQCAGNSWFFTPLIAYQSHGEYAPYSLAVIYYTDLMVDKGLVLMHGEIASNDLPKELASLLVHASQLFYGNDAHFDMVMRMNQEPNKFKHMDVISVCQKAKLF